MPSFKKAVLSRGDVSQVVMGFQPQEFARVTSPVAQQMFDIQVRGSDFQVSDATSLKAGLDTIERQSLDQKVDVLVLERLKEVQEKAYHEAYQLGLEQGQTKAFNEAEINFKQKIDHLDEFLGSIENLSSEILRQNEETILKLMLTMASRIAYREISQSPDMILGVLKETLGQIENEEQITVRVNPKDCEFLISVRETFAKEFFKKAKFEADERIHVGGCTIETFHGMTDATVEERVAKLWQSTLAKLPPPEGQPL